MFYAADNAAHVDCAFLNQDTFDSFTKQRVEIGVARNKEIAFRADRLCNA